MRYRGERSGLGTRFKEIPLGDHAVGYFKHWAIGLGVGIVLGVAMWGVFNNPALSILVGVAFGLLLTIGLWFADKSRLEQGGQPATQPTTEKAPAGSTSE
jgi:hypothetical protein